MKIKYILIVIILIINITSCTDEQECETETICYGDGNCIEKPISGTCF